MQKLFKFAIGIVFLACLVAMPLQGALAAEGVFISPIKFDELVVPGQVLERTVNVTNKSEGEKMFYAYLMDFKADGEGGKARLIKPGDESGSFLTSWIDISGDGVPLKPEQSAAFNFKINVPENAGPGGYYGAIIFGPNAEEARGAGAERGATIAYTQQTGALLLFQVKGEIEENADIKEFSTDKSIYSTPFAVKFMTRIQNFSNVHIKPIGTIEIKNMMGTDVAKIRVNDTAANVMPDSIRAFENEWADSFGIGKYTATLSMSYGTEFDKGGQGRKSLIYITEFWIIPWKIVTPFLISFVIVIILFWLFLRIYRNRAIKKVTGRSASEFKTSRRSNANPRLGMIFTILFLIFILLFTLLYFIFFS